MPAYLISDDWPSWLRIENDYEYFPTGKGSLVLAYRKRKTYKTQSADDKDDKRKMKERGRRTSLTKDVFNSLANLNTNLVGITHYALYSRRMKPQYL